MKSDVEAGSDGCGAPLTPNLEGCFEIGNWQLVTVSSNTYSMEIKLMDL